MSQEKRYSVSPDGSDQPRNKRIRRDDNIEGTMQGSLGSGFGSSGRRNLDGSEPKNSGDDEGDGPRDEQEQERLKSDSNIEGRDDDRDNDGDDDDAEGQRRNDDDRKEQQGSISSDIEFRRLGAALIPQLAVNTAYQHQTWERLSTVTHDACLSRPSKKTYKHLKKRVESLKDTMEDTTGKIREVKEEFRAFAAALPSLSDLDKKIDNLDSEIKELTKKVEKLETYIPTITNMEEKLKELKAGQSFVKDVGESPKTSANQRPTAATGPSRLSSSIDKPANIPIQSPSSTKRTPRSDADDGKFSPGPSRRLQQNDRERPKGPTARRGKPLTKK